MYRKVAVSAVCKPFNTQKGAKMVSMKVVKQNVGSPLFTINAIQRRRKTSFVADGCRKTAFLEQLGQVMEDLCSPTYRLFERGRSDGTNHELLKGNI